MTMAPVREPEKEPLVPAPDLTESMASIVEALRAEGGMALVVAESDLTGDRVAQAVHEAAPTNGVLFAGKASTLTADRFDDLLAVALDMERGPPDAAGMQAKLWRLHRQERMAIAVFEGAERLTRDTLLGLQAFVENLWPPAFGLVLVASPDLRHRLDMPADDPLRFVFAKVVDIGAPAAPAPAPAPADPAARVSPARAEPPPPRAEAPPPRPPVQPVPPPAPRVQPVAREETVAAPPKPGPRAEPPRAEPAPAASLRSAIRPVPPPAFKPGAAPRAETPRAEPAAKPPIPSFLRPVPPLEPEAPPRPSVSAPIRPAVEADPKVRPILRAARPADPPPAAISRPVAEPVARPRVELRVEPNNPPPRPTATMPPEPATLFRRSVASDAPKARVEPRRWAPGATAAPTPQPVLQPMNPPARRSAGGVMTLLVVLVIAGAAFLAWRADLVPVDQLRGLMASAGSAVPVDPGFIEVSPDTAQRLQ